MHQHCFLMQNESAKFLKKKFERSIFIEKLIELLCATIVNFLVS